MRLMLPRPEVAKKLRRASDATGARRMRSRPIKRRAALDEPRVHLFIVVNQKESGPIYSNSRNCGRNACKSFRRPFISAAARRIA